MPRPGLGHGAALGKCGQHAAVAVGAYGEPIGRFQQELARRRIDRRHRSLAENMQILLGHAKAVVRGKKIERLLVRCRTGHQVKRYSRPVPLGRGEDLFDMNLKQAFGPRRGRWETCPWDGRTPGGSPALPPPESRRLAPPQGPAARGRGLPPARSGSSRRPAEKPPAPPPARPVRGNCPDLAARQKASASAENRYAGFAGLAMPAARHPIVPKNSADAPGRVRAGLPAGRRSSRLPAHDHVRLDGLAGMIEVGAGVMHIKTNRVEFVAFGLG